MAVLAPDKTDQSRSYAERLASAFGGKLKVLDVDMASSAFDSTVSSDPFNMTTDASREVGMVIGCDFFVLVRSVNQRRSAFGRADYFEAYAAIYLVSSRTGRLIDWRLETFEAAKPEASAKHLADATNMLAAEIEQKIIVTSKSELAEPARATMEEPPDQEEPPKLDFRSPIPYRRVKPEYTSQANFYGVTATVDITVDVDAAGKIVRTEIVRWAGYGLDESVVKTVREMNWRPAERNGKPLPMRFLMRYNFKKMDKE
ncbi:MAG: TonB family protein [Pyrinomonadaceae bacterium]